MVPVVYQWTNLKKIHVLSTWIFLFVESLSINFVSTMPLKVKSGDGHVRPRRAWEKESLTLIFNFLVGLSLQINDFFSKCDQIRSLLTNVDQFSGWFNMANKGVKIIHVYQFLKKAFLKWSSGCSMRLEIHFTSINICKWFEITKLYRRRNISIEEDLNTIFPVPNCVKNVAIRSF